VPAPTLILLPGLDGTGDFFQPLLEAIADTVPTHVVRYPVDGAHDHGTCLKLAQAELPASGRYVVLGESFSGPVAISLAAQAPRGLAGLILSSSFAVNPRPRLSVIRPLLPYLPFHGTGISLRLSRFLVLGRGPTPDVRQLHQTILSRVPPDTMRRRLETVADCDVREALRRVHMPILCFVPRHDRLVPRSAARIIQQLAPEVRMVEIDAPHCLLQCAPRLAAMQIRGFLQALP
jgi:pimeloyl-[acyl-carrier protein] methyl ester esterase